MLAHERPFGVVERCRLLEDRVGDADLADVVQLGGACEFVELLGGHPESAADPHGELGDTVGVVLQAGLLGVHDVRSTLRVWSPRADGAAVLVGVHPLVGELQRVVGVVASCGRMHRAARGADRERLAVLLERAAAARDDACSSSARGANSTQNSSPPRR